MSAMKRSAIAYLLVCALASTVGAAQKSEKRTIPCKTPTIANSCYWTHGRLQYGNGTPALRLWKIGTHRILGIYSGPSVYHPAAQDPDQGDNENPQLPENVARAFKENRPPLGFAYPMFADFEVCPLEPERPHTMQAACIESAKNIVMDK